MNLTIYFISLMSIYSIFLVIEIVQDLFKTEVVQTYGIGLTCTYQPHYEGYYLKTVYLASPYSHDDEVVMMDREYDVTNAAAKLMEKHRVSFFLPITQSAAMKRFNPKLGTSFEAWKDIDLNEIRLRDEVWVLMLDGWDKSIGVLAEIEYAKELDKPIKYIYHKSLRFKKDKKTEKV